MSKLVVKKTGNSTNPANKWIRFMWNRYQKLYGDDAKTHMINDFKSIGWTPDLIKAMPLNNPKTRRRTRSKKTKKRRWPSVLVDLAIPISIDLEQGETLKFPLSKNFALCATRSGKEIWVFSKKGGKLVHTTDDTGKKLYEDFTGFEPEEVGKVVPVYQKSMVRLGRALNIVYRSDKFSKPGELSDYIHSFETYPIVSVDHLTEPSIVAIRGGRFKIKKEGITG